MSDISIQKIAEQTGLSKATISRALNHCGGVEAETALAIRQLAKEIGYTASDRGGASFCGIVLPETPNYYWQAAYKNLCAAFQTRGISMRAALYSRITHLESFFSALDAMIALSPQVLVVASPDHSATKERLQRIAAHTPIFLLSERIEGENLFYFGSDDRQDGITLARSFRVAYPDRHQMLVLDLAQNKTRTDAFLAACCGVHIVCRTELPDWHSRSAAVLARRIASEVTEPFDCVYCATGALPSVCLALDKLKIDSDVICIGYENPPGNQKFLESGRIGLTLCQDIAAQSELCAKAVIELKEKRCFPNQKYNYVDSRVVYAPKTFG